ncbi:CapA family protein [Candidatus Daviesbacteria bacterium]|nr:CapA family protein [Candidatus Daviesbacteria bacterium]
MIRLFLILVLVTFVTYFLFTRIIPTAKQTLDKVSFKVEAQLPKVNFETIFANDHSQVNSLPKDKLITVIATGDVIPARSVNYQSAVRKNFLWPYEKTSGFIADADITFINLETPLLQNCPLTQEGMIFCGSDRHIEGLVGSGIDVVSLANNHAGNWGQKGVEETADLLESNRILVTGIKRGYVLYEVKGIKFAFLGYSDIEKNEIVSKAEEDIIRQEIAQAKKAADVVIVTFHWGAEYKSQPDKRQISLGHQAIDSGADLIIGNHPHWIQPVEIYKDKLITYAHGNFIFDQEWSENTKLGVVGKYTFYGSNLVEVEYFPVRIIDYGQPYFLESLEKQKILDEMKNESLILSRSSLSE